MNFPFLDLGGNISIESNDGTGWGYTLNCITRLNGFTLSSSSANLGSVAYQAPITGNGQINFTGGSNYLAFQSGIAVTAPVHVSAGYLGLSSPGQASLAGPLQIDSGAIVELLTDYQINEHSYVLINPGAELRLGNHSCHFANLEMRGGLLSGGVALFSTSGDFLFNATDEAAVISGTVETYFVSNDVPVFSVNGPYNPALELRAHLYAGNIFKVGTGMMQLMTNNSLNALVVNDGVVELDHDQALGTNSDVYLAGGALSLRSANVSGVTLIANASSNLQLDERYGCLLTCLNSSSWNGPVLLQTNLFVFAAGDMTFSGPISGGGGLSIWSGTAHLTGAQANSFAGSLISQCQLLELGKPSGVNAYVGPLVVGGGAGAGPYEVRWLNPYQNVGANLTLYANGRVNLNNNYEDFGPVTFNGGEVDTGTGAFNIYAPVIVNPADSSAVINGYLGLPPGDNRVFIVGDGAADCDLIVNAVIFGSPGTCFVKQGAGTMCLAGANTFNAPTLLEEGILDINSGFGLGTWPGLVIFDGATLRISGGANVVGGFEAVGAGVGGIHGAVEVLPGNSFSMSGGILLDAATTINVGSGGALGLGGNIVGAGPLIKTGGGALVMQGSANNTYSGDTMVSAGSLLLAKSANKICVPGNLIIGPGPAGPVTFARLIYSGELGGTTVTVNGNSLFDLNGNNAILTQLTLNDGGSVWTGAGTLSLADGSSVNVGSQSAFGAHVASTISGYLSLPIGSATFNVSPHASTPPLLFGPELDVVATIVGGSSGLLTVVNKYGLGQIQLDGNNTYFNQTRVYEGTLLANNGLALGSSAAGTYVYNGASLALINGVSVAGEYLLLDSTNGAALDSRSSADVWGGPIYLNRNSSLNVNNSLTASGVIDGPGSLIKAGLGSLTLAGSGNNTYTGDTFVNQGTLLLDKPTAVTAIPGPVEVGAVDGSSAGVVRNLTSYQIVGNIFVHSQGLYDVNGQQENVDYLGLDGNAVVQTGAGYLSLKTGGAINVTPGINTTATINHHLYLDAGNHVITVGSGATLPGVHDLVINAVIGDNSSGGSIQKEGPGRMRFTADNTYLGSTLVNAGTLQLDGAQPQSSIGVQGGGRLQGNGTVANLNYTGAAGTIAPGASPGIFTCNGFNPGAFGSGTLEIELNGLTPGSEYDQVHSSGSVWLNGVTLDAHINFASAVSNEFTIIAKDGTGPVNGTFTGLPQGKKLYIGQELFQISYTGGTGNDVVLTRLVTPPPPVLRIERGDINAVRLLWATNNPAFSLQTTTNLTSTNWVAATPLPVVIGTNDVVTNAVSRLEQFYRLSNP